MSKSRKSRNRRAAATILFILGMLLFYYSNDAMLLLIYYVGEEEALGAENVTRLPEGGALLTNPEGMLKWMLPFLVPALGLIIVGVLLLTRDFVGLVKWLRSTKSPRS